MPHLDRRMTFGLLVGAAAVLLAWAATVAQPADARTRKKAGKSAKSAESAVSPANVGLFSCEEEFDKRPKGARLLQKDALNSGAWMLPGVDPAKAQRVTIWGCYKEFIEPSGQLRPYWRNSQKPPLPPPVKYEVCEPVAVSKIALDRAWFSCTPSHLLKIRID